MRKYQGEDKKADLIEVTCNKCAKKILVKNGIVIEGVFEIQYSWGYFSDKDGNRHSFDLCEKCYDEMIKTFEIPIEIEENKELI